MLPLECAGARCCNRIQATLSILDRMVMIQRLAGAGVPVPETHVRASWRNVLEDASGQPVVVKSVDGRSGRGIGVLVAMSGSLPVAAPFPGPYLVQQFVPIDGPVAKIYVIGSRAGTVEAPLGC